MEKAVFFDFEGLLYYFDGEQNNYVFNEDGFKKIQDLKETYKIVCLTNLERDNFEKIASNTDKIGLFDEVCFLNELGFNDRIKVFDYFDRKKGLFVQKYYIGDLFPFLNYDKIKDFTVRVNPHKDVEYLDANLDFKNSVVSVDLDGVLNDISRFSYDLYEIEKSVFEEDLGSKFTPDEFKNDMDNFDAKKKNELQKRALEIHEENEVLVPGAKEYIKKISKNNQLVLFSVTSRRRIKRFLEKHGLKDYFVKIYSARDDYALNEKTAKMFEDIKKDKAFEEYSEFVHIGDQYKLDFVEPKKAGFKAYLVDKSEYKKEDF